MAFAIDKKSVLYVWNQYHGLDWVVLLVMFLVAAITTTSVRPYCRSFSWDDATISYPQREDTFPTYSLGFMVVLALLFYIVFVWYLVHPLQRLVGEPLEWYALGADQDVAERREGASYAGPSASTTAKQLRIRELQTGNGPLYPWLRAQLWSVGLQICVMAVLKVYAGRLRPDYLERLHAAGYSSTNKDLPDPRTQPEFYCNLMDSYPELREGRLSFPSGHSSTSFAVFVIVFFFCVAHLRPFARHASFARLMVCLVPLIIPTMCAVSRTRDYKHHFSDIIAGSIIGVVSALLAFHGSFRHVGGATAIYFGRSATDVDYEQLWDARGGTQAVGVASTVTGGTYQAAEKRGDNMLGHTSSPTSRGDDSVVVTFNDAARRWTGVTERRLNEDPVAVPWI